MRRTQVFCFVIFLSFLSTSTFAQEPKTKLTATLYDGFIVAGYVNDGGYVNFGGPAIKLTHKPFSFIMGMLPSLRFKDDRVATGASKNSFVTPTLGAGFTAIYKHIALQVPVYYNAKTGATNGAWHAGIGLGYKF